jgi:hypothetical protein
MLAIPILSFFIIISLLLVQQPLLCRLRRCICSCSELLLLLLLPLGVSGALLLLDVFEMLFELLVPGRTR